MYIKLINIVSLSPSSLLRIVWNWAPVEHGFDPSSKMFIATFLVGLF